MNNQNVTFLVLLDLSAAFDTIDHDILFSRLESNIGLSSSVLPCFRDYVTGRSQQVLINNTLSIKFDIKLGLPQGSCLVLLLFVIYPADLFKVLQKHSMKSHAYADDAHLYLSFKPGRINVQNHAMDNIANCIIEIQQWMTWSNLKMNDAKTKFMIIGNCHQLSKHSVEQITIGKSSIMPSSSVSNRGVTLSGSNIVCYTYSCFYNMSVRLLQWLIPWLA